MSTTDATAVDVVRNRLRKLVEDKQLSQADVAAGIAMYSGVVSQWLAGTYEGNDASVALKVRAFLETRELQENAPKDLPFVVTSVALAVQEAINTALAEGCMALVYSVGPGAGKTCATRYWAATRMDVIYIHVTPLLSRTSLVRALTVAINERYHDSARGGLPLNKPTSVMWANIVEHCAKTRGVLVMDDVDFLVDRVSRLELLHMVRTLNDDTGYGVVLLGTELFITRLPLSDGLIRQFYDRLNYKIKVGLTPADVGQLASVPNVAECATLLKQSRGSARRLNFAHRNLKRRKVPVTVGSIYEVLAGQFSA
jgi:DNA transposition AAA+ family ATPase